MASEHDREDGGGLAGHFSGDFKMDNNLAVTGGVSAGKLSSAAGRSVLCAYRRLTNRCVAALVAAAALWLAAAPAGAVVGGQQDGNGHPYVAAIGQPEGGGIYFTGTAISPTVVLTAAHAVVRLERLGFTTARVTFDPVATSSSSWYFGTIHIDPAYDPTNTANPNDLAVIVLDTPATGITPASLPTEGLLSQLARQGPRASFQMIGDGISRYTGGANGGGQPTVDFSSTGTRKLAEGDLASVTSGWLRLQLDGGAAACIGDSGAPSLIAGSNVIAGVFIRDGGNGGGGLCQSQPWNMRVDTPSARAFLGQYVTLP